MSIDLSIVIPAYNEEQRIGPTLERLHAFLAARSWSWEIVVVDDGSKDGTIALVQRLAETIPHLQVIASTPNHGKGHVVRIGMLAARGAVRVMFDADGSMPPEELPKIVEPVLAGEVELAIGSRYAAGSNVAAAQPLYRRLWSRLCNQVVQRALVPGVLDTQCGFKAFSAEAAADLFGRARIDGWAFDLEILALARRRCYGIAEVAVEWHDDERSKVNPLKDFWKVIREAVTIRRNLRKGVYGQLVAAL
jgi:glycosyltransferase involved in cell wall biosynthesis